MVDTTRSLTELLAVLFQAHPWHGVPAYASSDVLNAYIEIAPTDTVKYELDKPSGLLRLDRPQRFSSLCPTLYGFIPQTYCGDEVAKRCMERTKQSGIEGDGDPLDVCVLSENLVAQGVLTRVKPIGGLRMIDGRQADDKIIAVLEADVAFGQMNNISELPRGVLDRLQHYFLSYKRRPQDDKARVEIAEVYDRTEALEVVKCSLADYRTGFGDPSARIDALRALLAK